MKILVCISKTPDTTSKISFINDNKDFNSEGIQYIMNPYDEWYALVKAIELKEKFGGTVTAICVGDSSTEIIIRKALAIGADDAIRIDLNPLNAMQTAKQIATQASNYDLILLGKETIDYNGAEVGAMLAELLDLPYLSFVNKLECDGNNFTISREIEGGTEIVSVDAPIVVSAAKGLAEQRIPNMQGIMMAKRKPLNVIPPTSFEDHTVILNHEIPSGKKGVTMVDANSMDELVRMLHEDAKVI
jgi:electron transfer flavoprotein beta subunit